MGQPSRGKAGDALKSARILDEIVAGQLAIVARLSEGRRSLAADHLAELVMLAQTYRHYARGWISRRELDRRGRQATERLGALRQPSPDSAHFTEQD
ncbi:MAG: hypothetical protein M3548_21745 [Actinomycetota bacterium]|nr:hypothetical protein [Actinomycetota bacterium]